MHNLDYVFQYDKNFTIKYKKTSSFKLILSGNLAYFSFEKNKDIKNQNHRIIIKSPSNFKTNLAKRTAILDSYIHESTHEAQYDRCILGYELNEYEKVLSNSFAGVKAKVNYLSDPAEIDTRLEIINRFTSLYKNGDIPITLSTLFSQIRNICEVFTGLELNFNKDKFLDSFNICYKYQNLIKDGEFRVGEYTNLNDFMGTYRKQLDKKLDICEKNIDYIYKQALPLLKQKFPKDYNNICYEIFKENNMQLNDVFRVNRKFQMLKEINNVLEAKCEHVILSIGSGDKKLDEELSNNVSMNEEFER